MSFATSINCIDGRVQAPITDYIKEKCRVDYVDVVTYPGCDRVLTHMSDGHGLDIIKRSVEISIAKHGSKVVYVSGHHDCAANPVDKEKHIEQIREAVALVRSWNPSVQVVGLWVDSNLQVEEVT